MISADDPRRGSRRRQGFTHKDKLISVVASEINGVPETAKALRVTEKALRRWRDDEELRPYVETTRRQIMGDVTTAAQKAWAETLVRLTNEPEAIPTRELLAIAAESTTKMQLLGGGATSRTETFGIVEHFNDAEAQELVNRARRYLAGNGPRARSALAVGPGLEVPPPKEPDPA